HGRCRDVLPDNGDCSSERGVLGLCCLTFHREGDTPLLAASSGHGKKIPFRSCPVSPNTLVDVLAAFEVNEKPFSLADQVIVAGVSANSPAKPFVASLTWTRRVTSPVQTTSNETVAGTEGPSLNALPRVK